MSRNEEAPGPVDGARGSSASLGGEMLVKPKRRRASRQVRSPLCLRTVFNDDGHFVGLEVGLPPAGGFHG